ncbi:S8 family serine peptidase [Rhodocaloribacter litoris]|uniref:S8 family serine peptidase n=1 Tax=Rhodocaloribacter litoris TaxID=2558931 RepID=UPI0014205469|nr:S8 family serine peptidase [Rhodocaloribacter litoris]QXD14667.1 S8 family serine peptidase [Rhodocaloribacter litoris]
MKRVATLVLFAFPLVVYGQVEVIVRLADEAGADLVAAMEGGAAKDGALAPLFEGVLAVQPVVARRGAGKQAGAFPAYVLAVPDSAAFEAVRARWAAQPGVAYVQPNRRYRLDGLRPDVVPLRAGDPLADSLGHLAVIRALEAWNVTTGRPEVRIGLIDTGVFFEHPDLAGQIAIHPGEDLDSNGRANASDFNGLDDDGNGYVDDLYGYDFLDRPGNVEAGDYHTRDPFPDEDNLPGGGRGHGTSVAGVLVAARDNGVGIAGVAPGVRLVPLRAFGADGAGDDDDIAAALVYAADNGLDVVNLSFGDAVASPLMHEAIRYAVDRGVVVVASAGNAGGDGPHYPSDYPEVISVAWFDADGRGLAARGTHGVGIDLGAPGSFVYTTLLPPPETPDPEAVAALYGRRSGSSMAAPMVAATAALLRSLEPGLTPAAVRSILTASARDIEAPGWDHRTAAGLLDVAAALLNALPARTEVLSPAQDDGVAAGVVPVLGTAVDPAFLAYSVEVAAGAGDPGDTWMPVVTEVRRQVWRDTLALWEAGRLPEGPYTLRLATRLRTGKTIEDRRRVYVDRSPPRITVHLLERALVAGAHGLQVDVETDDLTTVSLEVDHAGNTHRVASGRRGRRHGLVWTDASGTGGPVVVRLVATNAAGLLTTHTDTLVLPARTLHAALFDEETLAVPHGFLLPHATDFDGDGLREIVLNRYEDGWLGDTLAVYEWDGTGFRPAFHLIAGVFPRDTGDADGDGLLELLTQVGGATLVLEQTAARAYPSTTAFLDTTGLANPFDPEAAFGARLTDLDGDGRGEILVHNTRQWRLLEHDGSGFAEVARLENPTGVTGSELDRNEFQEPEALIDDFDGDGRLDLLVGDSDGDWILYEHDGDNTFRVAWTHETNRYNAGSRFARGDFDGDGRPEFVTYTQNWTQVTRDGEREPDAGLVFVWENTGEDAFALRHRFALAGTPLSRHGSLNAADFDGDGRDELVVVHPPDLYVLAFDAAGPQLRFHRGGGDPAAPSGLRSIQTVAADFDGDGRPELVAAGADGRLHRFIPDPAVEHTPPPQWVDAFALDARQVRLAWHAPGADSVTVLAGPPGAALDPIGTTTRGAWVDETEAPRSYALRAWFGGTASPLSPVRLVRPHAPAIVAAVTYPGPATVELAFTEPLAPGLLPGQFRLDRGGEPAGLLAGKGGRSVLLRFDTPPPADTLRWTGVRDAEGTPVGQTAAAVAFPEPAYGTLIVTAFELLDPARVALVFSEALDPAFAADAANYRLRPAGHVAEARFDAARPDRVTLRVEGRVLGATGLATSVEVLRMRSLTGNTLAPEGTTVRLTVAAEDLAGVYVFPNPYEAGRHPPRVMIAGLPPEATVRILSVQGGFIRLLEETDGDGGVAWDLNDDGGRPVPSGIYLVRVEAPGHAPVLRKAAVIR